MKISFASTFVVLTALVWNLPARAQLIDWGTPTSMTYAITGVSDISTAGTSFDAIQGEQGKPVETIGDTTFNLVTTSTAYGYGDGLISFSANTNFSGADGGFTSASPSSSAYASVLAGCAYVAGQVGTVTISGLTANDEYQVQLWNATGVNYGEADNTDYSGVAPLTLGGGDYALGTFTATGSTESFTYTYDSNSHGFGVVSDIAVRELPEPSTWALMLGGVAFLLLLTRRNLRRA
jgi:hypothetical protein